GLHGTACREVFTATLIQGRHYSVERGWQYGRMMLLVTANSGADGRLLWRTLQPLTMGNHAWNDFSTLGPLRWCPAGPDGRPYLAVTFLGWPIDGRGKDFTFLQRVVQTFLFTAADGKLGHIWPGAFAVDTAHLHGGGVPAWYGLRLP